MASLMKPLVEIRRVTAAAEKDGGDCNRLGLPVKVWSRTCVCVCVCVCEGGLRSLQYEWVDDHEGNRGFLWNIELCVCVCVCVCVKAIQCTVG